MAWQRHQESTWYNIRTPASGAANSTLRNYLPVQAMLPTSPGPPHDRVASSLLFIVGPLAALTTAIILNTLFCGLMALRSDGTGAAMTVSCHGA
jgi:hypothetical protein